MFFNAFLTSCTLHLPRSISSISSVSSLLYSSTGLVGSSLFNISLKCSTHLCSFSRAGNRNTPSRFATENGISSGSYEPVGSEALLHYLFIGICAMNDHVFEMRRK